MFLLIRLPFFVSGKRGGEKQWSSRRNNDFDAVINPFSSVLSLTASKAVEVFPKPRNRQSKDCESSGTWFLLQLQVKRGAKW